MAQLSKKIELYAEANGVSNIDFLKDVILEDIGQGPYIKEWNLDITKPTDSQLASYETAGNTAETNDDIDATRRSQYGSWQEQMEMIYKDQKNGTSTFKDHCDKVRSDNPKE
tara:strand:- start:32 stop:367 length:336 start_codon:yes stop_codon:yes gene_type:complete